MKSRIGSIVHVCLLWPSACGPHGALALSAPHHLDRRTLLTHALVTTSATVATAPPVLAAPEKKSRTDGYAVVRPDREWSYLLSGAQYNVLRRGGTERQKSSILNTFTSADAGTYRCAGCNNELFSSTAKFSSGTGWPSFASALDGVEVEKLDVVRATLDGREVRCGRCGGHLGDVFNDGWIYVGTAASATGKRYCINGAALVLRQADSDSAKEVYGDMPPPNKVINYEQSLYR